MQHFPGSGRREIARNEFRTPVNQNVLLGGLGVEGRGLKKALPVRTCTCAAT